jgi:hypothetical protein
MFLTARARENGGISVSASVGNSASPRNPYTNVDAWWMSGAEAIPEVRLADEGIRHVLRYSWMSHMIAALQ